MEEKELSRWSMYCFLMNTMIGAGVLAVPKAFQTAGVVASAVLLALVAALGWMMAREILAVTDKLTQAKRKPQGEIEQPLLSESTQQWDLPEIVRALLGPSCSYFYFLVMCFYFCGSLTVYTNIFGTAFGSLGFDCDYSVEDLAPGCEGKYLWGIVIFGVLVAVIASLDYTEQAALQYVMMGLQMVVVVIVIGYCVWRGGDEGPADSPAVNLDYVGSSVMLFVFAGNYHGVFPSILAASQQNQSVQKSVIVMAAVSMFLIYGLLGAISAVTIPHLPDNVSHLLHSEYFGYSPTDLPWLLVLLKVMIILFPVADICSNAPVTSQSMSGVLISCIYGTDHHQVRARYPISVRLSRAFCMLPAVLLAATSHRFGILAAFPGVMLLLLIFVYVPMCYNRAMDTTPHKSEYEIQLPGVRVVNYVLSIGFLAMFGRVIWEKVATFTRN